MTKLYRQRQKSLGERGKDSPRVKLCSLVRARIATTNTTNKKCDLVTETYDLVTKTCHPCHQQTETPPRRLRHVTKTCHPCHQKTETPPRRLLSQATKEEETSTQTANAHTRTSATSPTKPPPPHKPTRPHKNATEDELCSTHHKPREQKKDLPAAVGNGGRGFACTPPAAAAVPPPPPGATDHGPQRARPGGAGSATAGGPCGA